MVFSSVAFIFYFVPLFLLFYYLCGARNGALLVGSVIFYTWGEGLYLVLLAVLIVVNFYCGIAIDSAMGGRRKWFVALGVAVNLSALAYFKYAGFIVSNVANLTG